MKNKKKITVITIVILLVTILSIVTYNLSLDKEIIMSDHTNKNNDNGIISLLVETGFESGTYREFNDATWPEGYKLNKTLSKCENGATLEFDEVNKKISISANTSDRCYVYFDSVPEDDVHIAVANTSLIGGRANLTCSGGSANYSNKYNRIEVGTISKSLNCTLSYSELADKKHLNSVITKLSGTTQGNGKVVNENGYRYEGKNPNNYIWFNNEMWRIIGVFDSTSHGVANTNLVKIIRRDSIGGLAWDKSDKNNWNTASIKLLLNNEYLNSQDGTNGDNCYGYSTTAKAKCDYREVGIKEKYKKMIKEVTWYLGGYKDNSITVVAMYGYERNSSNKYSSNPASITAKVGLIYASDNGYAVPSEICSRSKTLTSYSSSDTSASCTLNNWLYDKGSEWTITPNSNNGHSTYFSSNSGSLQSTETIYGYATRPVLYLDSSVYVIDGDGSESNPYIIGM